MLVTYHIQVPCVSDVSHTRPCVSDVSHTGLCVSDVSHIGPCVSDVSHTRVGFLLIRNIGMTQSLYKWFHLIL